MEGRKAEREKRIKKVREEEERRKEGGRKKGKREGGGEREGKKKERASEPFVIEVNSLEKISRGHCLSNNFEEMTF